MITRWEAAVLELITAASYPRAAEVILERFELRTSDMTPARVWRVIRRLIRKGVLYSAAAPYATWIGLEDLRMTGDPAWHADLQMLTQAPFANIRRPSRIIAYRVGRWQYRRRGA